jgi:hypothetical protein
MSLKNIHTFNLNAKKLQKHWKKYCLDMGIDSNQWNSDIHMTPEKMMEGTSPTRLRAIFTNINSGVQKIFAIGKYYGKYEIMEVK